MYYLIYEITNIINNKKYRGKRETNNLDDGYLGSGLYIKRAIKKYGRENFIKEILFMAFDKNKLNEAEKIFVDKTWLSLGSEKVYNLKIGGNGGFRNGMVSIKGRQVPREEFLSNDNLVGCNKGKVPVVNKEGKKFTVNKDDNRIKTKELIPILNMNGNITAYNENGKFIRITKEEYLTGKYKHESTNKVSVKDKEGKIFRVDKDDIRYTSGELVGVSKNIPYKKGFYFVIYDNKGNVKFECKSGFIIEFLRNNNLPTGAFIKSYKNNGEPIYNKVGSNMSRLIKSGLIKYKGWYCIKRSEND